MADLTDLENQSTALQKALSNPVKSAQHGDKMVTNRSVNELRAMNSDVNKKIGRAGGRRQTRQIRIMTNRGL